VTPRWGRRGPIRGPARGGKVIHLAAPALHVGALHFADPAAAPLFRYLYLNGNTHGAAPGALAWWGIGAKIVDPEWIAGRPAESNARVCLQRLQPVELRVKLVSPGGAAVSGTLVAEPTLDGNGSHLTRTEVAFSYPAGAADQWLVVRLQGRMPDEVGRFILRIRWSVKERAVRFQPLTTELRAYCLYGEPLDPGYDSPVDADPGRPLPFDQGTGTGTAKRLDKLTGLFPSRRHPAGTPAAVIDLLWRLHVGINDTPGAPPYFDAGHDEHLTADGTSRGTPIDVADQWLAWLTTPDPHWNDASCIGHVQLLKTMAASLGLFARRCWVFPSTSRLPDGTTPALADTDLYCLGTYDSARQQSWHFVHNARTYRAVPKLMEPGQGWENFEACLRSPSGRFLPGGYPTSSCPAAFRTTKGFASAGELIRWWSNTSRSGFGRRFLCWVYHSAITGETHCWDVDGTHYDIADYVRIRERGKTLPPPT